MKPSTLIPGALAVLAIGMTTTLPANAQRGPGHAGAFGMLRHDQNQDGQITLQEFTSVIQSHFSEQDTDGDGVITSQERNAARAERRETAQSARFAALDKDGDGQLSASEYADRPNKATAQQGAGRKFRAGSRNNPGRGANGSDVTYAEFSERALEHFKTIDANDDNVVTQTELHAAAGARRTRQQ